MSIADSEKIEKAIIILQKIAKGINPIDSEPINDESFLNDPRIIRCFFFVTEILQNVNNGAYSFNKEKMTHFIITPEQKQRVRFPESKIGVNESSKCVNHV